MNATSSKQDFNDATEDSTMVIEEVGNSKEHCWYNASGQLHRLNGPAVIWPNSAEFWYIEDKRHRLDGPAVTLSTGTKFWYVMNKKHRLDGPAVEWSDGRKEWWIEDKKHTEEEFNVRIKALEAPIRRQKELERHKSRLHQLDMLAAANRRR